MIKRKLTFRILWIAFVSILVALGTIIYIRNDELRKIVPASMLLSTMIALGQIFVVFSTNYYLAERFKSLYNMKLEALIVVTGAIISLSISLPYLFPRQISNDGFLVLFG